VALIKTGRRPPSQVSTTRVIMSAPHSSAARTHRTTSWGSHSGGPNTANSGSIVTLRNRSRQAERNDPWIANALKSLTSNEIGTGIIPRPQISDDKLREDLINYWDVFSAECDPEGVLDIYGKQRQIAFNRRLSGEVFIRRRRRSVLSGLSVPLQIQVLEADHVPIGHNRALKNGRFIMDGIEFNRRGARLAYWMHANHPGDGKVGGRLIRVPAADVIHHYNPSRPGAVRGVPDSSKSLLRAHDYDSYNDSEMRRKSTRSGYAGFLYREIMQGDQLYDPITGVYTGDGPEPPPTEIQGGDILTGVPGEKLDLFDGDNTGQGYAEFQRLKKMEISAGLGIPYELMSGDYSGLNDRLVRAIQNQFFRAIEADQEHLAIFQVCRKIFSWFADSLSLVDRRFFEFASNKNELMATLWWPQAWRHLHPVQDIAAKKLKIEAGLSSRQTEAARDNIDIEVIDKQRAEDDARAGKNKLIE